MLEFKVSIHVLITSVLLVRGQDEVITNTRLGEIKGIRKPLVDSNLTVVEFLKVPFAKAPIGNLRFEKPQAYGAWSGTLDATQHGPSCYQLLGSYEQYLVNKNISEDCLHLNIYVPHDVFSNNSKSVMIYIHGGAYLVGQAQLMSGKYLAITGDVIVVIIQYRLNVFGFFSKDGIVGNYGLWDQIMAIQWVKDNIASFGGNAESITIFGESAGGFSVGLLSLIPQNRGLFQSAILQSGTALSPYSVTTKTFSKNVASYLNCSQTDASISKRCLQNVRADDLLMASYNFMSPSSCYCISYAPVVDNDLLKDEPANLLANKESEEYKFFRSLNVVVGTVSGESSLLLDTFTPMLQKTMGFNISEGIPKRVLCDVFAPDVAVVAYNNDSKIADAICKFYRNSTDDIAQGQNMLNAYSDFTFNIPAIETLHIHSGDGNNGANHYHYIFSRPSPIPLGNTYPAWFDRAEHGSEIVFEFPSFIMSPEDTNLAMIFMKYWTHFAITGNMNVPGLPHWKEYDIQNGHYINFDVPITTGQHLFKERKHFWLNTIPAMLPGPTSITISITPHAPYVLFLNCVVLYNLM